MFSFGHCPNYPWQPPFKWINGMCSLKHCLILQSCVKKYQNLIPSQVVSEDKDDVRFFLHRLLWFDKLLLGLQQLATIQENAQKYNPQGMHTFTKKLKQGEICHWLGKRLSVILFVGLSKIPDWVLEPPDNRISLKTTVYSKLASTTLISPPKKWSVPSKANHYFWILSGWATSGCQPPTATNTSSSDPLIWFSPILVSNLKNKHNLIKDIEKHDMSWQCSDISETSETNDLSGVLKLVFPVKLTELTDIWIMSTPAENCQNSHNSSLFLMRSKR